MGIRSATFCSGVEAVAGKCRRASAAQLIEYTFCSTTSHPNIVRVHDHGVHDGNVPFIVMPQYEGSIASLTPSLSPSEKLRLVFAVIDGIEAAHLSRVYRNRLSDIVVTDFGIARFVDPELYTNIKTKAASRLANFKYRAPEQLSASGHVDFGTDIFALGLIINELYTGQIPAGTGHKQIGDVLTDYAYLDPIVERMIRQNIADRYSSIDEVKRDFIKAGRAEIARQKLRELDGRVVEVSEPDDPLISDPPRVVDIEWRSDRLHFTLNREVTSNWLFAFQNMGSHQYFLSCAPNHAWFSGRMASVVDQRNLESIGAVRVTIGRRSSLVHTGSVHQRAPQLNMSAASCQRL